MNEEALKDKIIKALSLTFGDVPFIAVKSIKKETRSKEGVTADASIKIEMRERKSKLLFIEIKNSGQPRLVREAINQLFRILSKTPDSYGIIAAPYISPVSAEICKQEGVGYLDLAGNCRISFDDVYICREGVDNPFAVKRDLRSLYSPRSSRIVRALLCGPQKYWKVAPLAKESSASTGLVANVKKLLKDREWIEESEDGFRLIKPVELLTEWSGNYSFRKNKVTDYYCMSELSATEAELAALCAQWQIPFALTGLSGAARVQPGIRFPRTMAYIGSIDEEIINKVGLKTVTSGANVSLLSPYDEGVFYGAIEYEGISVVSPVQLYLDLISYKGRGEEAAQTVLERSIKPLWQVP